MSGKFGNERSMSELRRKTVMAPVDAAHRIRELEKRVGRLVAVADAAQRVADELEGHTADVPEGLTVTPLDIAADELREALALLPERSEGPERRQP